ncbi:hypothetical protein CMUST_12635 [Corynebacterium mustelae]|uniref:Uncharacterized protein n=1 Tax=Corynebacterium mustelae TaxID=571915 RepID=A0A0G3H6T6_9CORY|nr:hypothetical protein [Corynebacterium mustelae]AKK06832.1 hypothetical protein CMUST_12635 [Corynebacterium mustelae]
MPIPVYRLQQVSGVTVYGMINNGGYFLTDFTVYEDGIVDCWGKTDVAGMRDHVESGWVVPAIPVGETVRISELGDFRVLEARWSHATPGEYLGFLESVVDKLRGEQSHPVPDFPLSRANLDEPHPKKTDPMYNLNHAGATVAFNLEAFLRTDAGWEITTIVPFADETFRLSVIGERDFSFAECENMIDAGDLAITITEDAWVRVANIGELRLKPEFAIVENVTEFKKSLQGQSARAVGKQMAAEKCRQAYFEYLKEPSDFSREMLREAYEAVPEHERRYLGDMDSKDYDYYRILYTDDKREV